MKYLSAFFMDQNMPLETKLLQQSINFWLDVIAIAGSASDTYS
jgi:hypothetical protein